MDKRKDLMHLKHHESSVIKSLVITILVLSIGASVANGQSRQLLSWKEALSYIGNSPASELTEQRDTVIQIRAGVESWLKLHPGSTIQLQSAPSQPWNSEQILKEVSVLREAVEALLKEDRGQPFDLGVTIVSVTSEASPLSPITESIDHKEIEELHATNAAEAIRYLPGLSVDHKPARNQSGIMVRGFDTRQVGIYLDSVPIYVPYDGYADIGRFLTSYLAEIEVSKGYSSPLLGPNGLGGTVNLVTRKPEKKLEGNLLVGSGSGNMLESDVHLGSRWEKFFIWGGMDWLQTDYYPVSGNFTLNEQQPSYERTNSDQRDILYSGRVGWTPRGQDQYVFTYTKQKADYGSPPYSGIDLVNNNVQYRRWDFWNRDSYYLNTNTGLGESSSVRFRAFYDKYPNATSTYTDNTYSTLSGYLEYDDYSAGFSGEFSTRRLPRHALSASFFFKDDTHKEQGFSLNKKGQATVDPWRTDRDQLVSLGVQDAITISSRVHATVGFSADHLNGIKAQDVNSNTNPSSIVPFECESSLAGGSISSCLAHVWDYNPLASISYSVAKSGTLYFTFARKSHFPTLKDRYSYKNDKAIPNPTLQPEHANNWELGYSHVFPFKSTIVQLDLFRSDVYDAIQNATIAAEFPDQCPALSTNTCQQSINIGKETHQGVEFTVRSSPVTRLMINANYTYLNRRFFDAPGVIGVFPTGTPKHKVVAIANLRLPLEIMLVATARYESGTIDTNNSGQVVPASRFATADLGGIIPLWKQLDLQGGVKNIFDRFYYYREGYPEAGRNWYLNMRYRF
jgi:iron complex outermembrane receptor protein